jgi:hypothetical protein
VLTNQPLHSEKAMSPSESIRGLTPIGISPVLPGMWPAGPIRIGRGHQNQAQAPFLHTE